MTCYIISVIVAGVMILLAALVSNAIKFEGGSSPKDPGKRKMWFWVIAILNPILFFVVARFVMAPNPADDQMVYDDYMKVVPIALGVGFVAYIVIGFALSKMFKHGKIGNWF